METNEWIRELNGLCIKKQFKGNYDFFTKWFTTAFPNNQDPTYANEWIDRFLSGTPHSYMDIERLTIYINMLKILQNEIIRILEK